MAKDNIKLPRILTIPIETGWGTWIETSGSHRLYPKVTFNKYSDTTKPVFFCTPTFWYPLELPQGSEITMIYFFYYIDSYHLYVYISLFYDHCIDSAPVLFPVRSVFNIIGFSQIARSPRTDQTRFSLSNQ